MPEANEQLSKSIASVFRVLALWNFDASEIRGLLGFPFAVQIAEWQAGNIASMSHDVVRRLRHVGAIHNLLRNEAAGAARWLREPLAQFGNQSPVMRMSSGDAADLIAIRDLLKSRESFQVRLEALRRGQ